MAAREIAAEPDSDAEARALYADIVVKRLQPGNPGHPSSELHKRHKPLWFHDVAGSAVAVSTMAAFARNKAIKPFLLLGPSGTGKSSLGHVYARSYCCTGDRHYGYEPCDACEACIETARMKDEALWSLVKSISVAAETNSGRGAEWVLDELRSTTEVLIVDEADRLLVHQQRLLSFLDRELTRPVIFASTHPEKFDAQFLSRVMALHMQPPDDVEMARHLVKVACAEGFSLPEEAVRQILASLAARKATGQVRDALQELEMYLTVHGNRINLLRNPGGSEQLAINVTTDKED